VTSEKRCSHVFEPAERPDLSADDYSRITDEDGQWHCPHRVTTAVDDTDSTAASDSTNTTASELCLFHRDPTETDPEAVAEAFRRAVADGDRSNEFLDARFARLDLSYAVLESPSNRPLDLRAATVNGDLRLAGATVGQRLVLDDATIGGELDCRGATFRDVFAVERATVADQIDFQEARFDRELHASDATFESDCRWFQTTFAAGAFCNRVEFASQLNAHDTHFGDDTDFSEASFADAQFRRAAFDGAIRFLDCRFEAASFAGARFHDLAYFDGSHVPERLSFDAAAFDDVVSLEELRATDAGTTVGLRNATVSAGQLHPASEGMMTYDLRDATVGEVTLSDGDHSSTLLDNYRFLNTTFEGFDFGTYRDALAAVDWQLHEVTEPLRTPPSEPDDFEPSPAEVESTFLKAKNGANEMGDTTVAAEFFEREMRARRRVHARVVRRGGRSWFHRATAVTDWVGNLLLAGTAGYGERPSRVIGTAGLTVGIFTLGFWGLLSEPPHGHPVGYLVVSLESFLTLVLAGGVEITDPWIRLVALVEGFFGAFLVALFVFTLTRSIHR
jgi:uncharacterized protein YjbI with pentapeptide repeats